MSNSSKRPQNEQKLKKSTKINKKLIFFLFFGYCGFKTFLMIIDDKPRLCLQILYYAVLEFGLLLKSPKHTKAFAKIV